MRVQFDSLRSKILAAVVEAKSVVVESGRTFHVEWCEGEEGKVTGEERKGKLK